MNGWAFISLFALACSAPDRSPVGAVRAFIDAASAQDRAEVYRLLGPRTRARLDDKAKRAGELAGHAAFRPEEMLAAGMRSPGYHASALREIERTGDHATVEVDGGDRVDCVKVGTAWRIELP